MPRKNAPRNTEPQLPERGSLSNLDIEPPLLVDPNSGGSLSNSTSLSAPSYDPSTDVPETPYRNPILGNKDWIKEYWNQFSPQDSIDEALDPWLNSDNPRPPIDYEHPDDALFFSPSRETSKDYNQVSVNDPNATTITGNASTPFNPSRPSPPYSGNLSNFGNVPGLFPNYYNASLSDLGYGSGYPKVSVPNEYNVSSSGEATSTMPVGTPGANGAVWNGTEWTYPDQPTTDLAKPNVQQAPQSQGITRTGQQSTTISQPQNLLGVGQNSGQHYYSTNGGRTWAPVSGSAPQEVRFAQNSGTGNWQADQTTNNFLLSGGYPLESNAWQSDIPNTFYSGVRRLDPEGGGFNQTSDNRSGGKSWIAPGQGQAPPIYSTDPQSIASYNRWITAHNPAA